MTRMKLSIGIVNFDSGYRLQQCIDSLTAHPPRCSYEVLVVDNASTDGSADFLRDAPRAGVHLITSPVNLLYTGGYNLLYTASTGEFFMILNPDHVVLEGALDALVRHMEEDPSLGAVGGYTLNREGVFERYLSRFPTPLQVFVANCFSARAKDSRLLRPFQYDMRDEDFSKPVVVPAPTGGCVLLRRAAVGALPMSREFGLFWSDAALFRHVWASGHRIMVFPDAPFLHDHDGMQRAINSEKSLMLVLDYLVGCETYFRKYHGRRAALTVKFLFTAGAVTSLLVKHLPRAVAGKERWSMWRTRVWVIVNFVRRRNLLLLNARAQALESGFQARYPVL